MLVIYTINPEYNSTSLYWFFETRNINKIQPLMLWLNGGPGSSSMTGLFGELGPYKIIINETNDFKINNH